MGIEYLSLAETTKRQWERSLTSQRSLSIQLQENFEALAKQMHGLETEARRASKRGMNLSKGDLEDSYQFPVSSETQSLNSQSSTNSSSQDLPPLLLHSGSPKLNGSSKIPGGAQRMKCPSKKGVSFNIPSSPSPEPEPQTTPSVVVGSNELDRTGSPIEFDEDDDDQFYDAEEGGDLPDSSKTGKQNLHRRTESSVSVNESQIGSPVPESIPPENLPATNTGGRVLVSPNSCCFDNLTTYLMTTISFLYRISLLVFPASWTVYIQP